MLLFFVSCLATKIHKLEQDILALQEQNDELEVKVERLEGELNEMEQPVQQMKLLTNLFNGQPREQHTAPLQAVQISVAIEDAAKENISISMAKLADQEIDVFRQVRIIPHRNQAGQTDGYRVSGIRRNSIVASLGFKNGDILMAINGQPATSMLMDLYVENFRPAALEKHGLRQQRAFEVLISRRQQNLLLSIQIED